MKILYIACHSHVGWGAEYWINEAFRDQSVETVLYDYKSARKSLKPWWWIKLDIAKLVKKEKPELILLQRARYMPAYVLKGIEVPKVLWSTEPIQLKSCVDKLLKSNIFNWVFVHSYSCLERIKKEFTHLRPNCSVMHNACPKPIIDKTCSKERFAVFNRTMSPRREEWLSPSKELIQFEQGKYGDEYFKDLAISEVAPNVHFSNENIDDFESGIFEAMAKGCVVVSETLNPQTVKDLQMEDSFITVSSPEDMLEKLQDLKDNTKLIKEYRQKSYNAIEHNTWHARVKLFITKFEDLLNR